MDMKKKVTKDNNFARSDCNQMLIVKDVINETVDMEPSFYHKEEISDDVKSVMRHIDDVLKDASQPMY